MRHTVFVFLLCFPVMLSAADKPTPVAKARAEVKANMATPEGEAYETQLSDDFWMSHSEAVTKCVDSSNSSHGSMEVLVRFAKDGSVGEVLVTPGNKTGDCIRQNLLREKFPPPPKADYWMHIDMQFQK